MKTLRIFLLAFIAMLCSVSSRGQEYNYDFETDGIYYKISSLENLEVEVVKGENKYSGDIVLPATVNFRGKEMKVSSIGEYCFSNCSGLTSTDLKDVSNIAAFAFQHCSGLTSIDLKNVSKIGSFAFIYCTGITSLYFKNRSDLAAYCFANCTGLTFIDFEDVSIIGLAAFGGCSGLMSIDLKNVSKIDQDVFSGCTALRTIKNQAQVPVFLYESSFDQIVFLDATLQVPFGCKSAYQNAPVWKNFSNIVEVGSENKVSLNVECNDGGRVDFGEFTVASGKVTEVFEKGEKVTLKFIKAKGFKLKSVYVGGEDVTAKLVNNSYEVTLNETTDVVATFEKLPFTLTLQQADNGNIKLDVVESQSYKLQINPAEGWKINTVTFNGVDVTSELDAQNNFKTPGILENSVLNVSFELIESTAVAAVDLNNISVTGYDNAIYVSGAKRGDLIYVYTVEGSLIAKVQSTGENLKMDVPESKVYFVKVGERTFKLSL